MSCQGMPPGRPASCYSIWARRMRVRLRRWNDHLLRKHQQQQPASVSLISELQQRHAGESLLELHWTFDLEGCRRIQPDEWHRLWAGWCNGYRWWAIDDIDCMGDTVISMISTISRWYLLYRWVSTIYIYIHDIDDNDIDNIYRWNRSLYQLFRWYWHRRYCMIISIISAILVISI